jgi:hypothetical protein
VPSTLLAISGTEGRISIAGTNLNLSYHDEEAVVDDIPTTNFESDLMAGAGGANTMMAKEGITGAGEVTANVHGFWDANANPMANPPNIIPGVLNQTVDLYLRKTGARTWSFSSIRILSVKTKADAQQGGITFEFKFKSNGSWQYAA